MKVVQSKKIITKKIFAMSVLIHIFCFADLLFAFDFAPSWDFGHINIAGSFSKDSQILYGSGTLFDINLSDADTGVAFSFSPLEIESNQQLGKADLFFINAEFSYNTFNNLYKIFRLAVFARINWLTESNTYKYRFMSGLEFSIMAEMSPFCDWKFPLIFKAFSAKTGFRLDYPAKPSFFCSAGITLSLPFYGLSQRANKNY